MSGLSIVIDQPLPPTDKMPPLFPPLDTGKPQNAINSAQEMGKTSNICNSRDVYSNSANVKIA